MVAIDGSTTACAALLAAGALAAAYDAQLTAVHVLPPTEFRIARVGPVRPIQAQRPEPFEDQVLLDARDLAWPTAVC